MMDSLHLIIPRVPPSVNHYVVHTRGGGHYKRPDADTFAWEVKIAATGRSVAGEAYTVWLHVYLGAKQKGDVDNFPKVALDSLVTAGVIVSDAWVKRLEVELFRDRENPRTEIYIFTRQVATTVRRRRNTKPSRVREVEQTRVSGKDTSIGVV